MRLKGYLFAKRVFDIIASIIGIIGTSPLWLIAVIGIEISDPGPVFYVARRIGKDNKEFPMYKFRSMRQGEVNESVFRGEEDRIFPFGKFIRNTKIDELPQLLCIVTGSMSVIGPRPAAKDQMEITRGGRYAIASKVKPGLSGPAALYDYIYGDTVTDEKEYEEKVLPTRLELELFYVAHRSWLYDIKLIWDTVVCVFASVFKKEPKKIFKELLTNAEQFKSNEIEAII
ncbi:MAG: sugar transferase [Clostridiales bacterium]|nr:sugar transferase [Clostridiales bacterium]